MGVAVYLLDPITRMGEIETQNDFSTLLSVQLTAG